MKLAMRALFLMSISSSVACPFENKEVDVPSSILVHEINLEAMLYIICAGRGKVQTMGTP